MSENPKSRREVWLSVALAVARDGLAEPKRFGVNDDNGIVSMTLSTHADVHDWCAALSFDAPNSDDGSLWAFGERDGWDWQLSSFQSPAVESSELAEQVAAAILTPDADVLPAPADEPRCPDPECGEPLSLIEAGLVGHCGRECGAPFAGAEVES